MAFGRKYTLDNSFVYLEIGQIFRYFRLFETMGILKNTKNQEEGTLHIHYRLRFFLLSRNSLWLLFYARAIHLINE